MKVIRIAVVSIILLAFAVPASALFGLSSTLEGRVQSISENSLSVTTEEEGAAQEMVEIQINEETKFDQQTASLDNLQEGDQVQIKYKEEAQEKIAVSIAKVMPAEGSPDASGAPPATQL
ncbi:MAG: DUF5666 domain-containing protein [Candidatus Omnitrophota bacterium]